MSKIILYGLGLISLLSACAPKDSIIYMSSENGGNRVFTYVISDSDNKVKKEILEAEGDVKIPKNLKERLMAETDQMGLVVKIDEEMDKTNVTVFFPIIYNCQEWLGEYLVEGYFIKKIRFYDYESNGTLDRLDRNDREKFKNTIKASERVLKKHKR